jgi:hypothetical protein
LAIVSLLKQFAAASHLRVRGILHLHPRCRNAISFVSAMTPFPDDTLAIVLATRATPTTGSD